MVEPGCRETVRLLGLKIMEYVEKKTYCGLYALVE